MRCQPARAISSASAGVIEFAILAPGPSLTREIAESVGPCIVVTSAYPLRMNADALVANDAAFWKAELGTASFTGRKFSTNQSRRDVERVPAVGQLIASETNSALLALHVALTVFKAQRVVYYGLDMSAEKGAHYFGSYPAPLINTKPARFEVFKAQFAAYAKKLPAGVEVFNATRGSALTCFPQLIT